MKVYFSLILILWSSFVIGQTKYNLLSSKSEEFEAGKKDDLMLIDHSIVKKKGILKLPCKTFKDDTSDENYCEFKYIGSIKNNTRFKIIEQESYNGSNYIILDSMACKSYSLLGFPHIKDSVIVNFNESETTDKKKVIEIWKISDKEIRKVKSIDCKIYADFIALRFINNKAIVIKDVKNKYWKVNF